MPPKSSDSRELMWTISVMVRYNIIHQNNCQIVLLIRIMLEFMLNDGITGRNEQIRSKLIDRSIFQKKFLLFISVLRPPIRPITCLFTQVCICLSSSCTLQWISQQLVMMKTCFSFMNTLLVSNESLLIIRI